MKTRTLFLLAILIHLFPTAYAQEISVCFAPNENCEQQAVDFLHSSTSSLDVAMFQMNLDSATEALMQLAQKNIRVRLLLDKSMTHLGRSSAKALIKFAKQSTTLEVRYGVQQGRMHNKFAVVDGTRVSTGSFNYTDTASHENRENLLVIDQPKLATLYENEFEMLWAGGQKTE
jgi:phosphatidylserine/phosphatidylglycerophosphate/cardiolipin synthase-like enzyme